MNTCVMCVGEKQVRVSLCACINMYVYIYTNICVYKYVYVCMYVDIYVYTYM